MRTLSIQRPRPSMEIRTPARCSTPVKRGEVNWLPWMPFCLSSGDWELIDLAPALARACEFLSSVCTAPGSLDKWLAYAARLKVSCFQAARAASGLR